MNPVITQKMFPVITAQNAAALRSQIEETQKYRKQYDFVRTFTATAGQQGAAEIPMPSEGDFQILGYNAVYSAQTDGSDPLAIRFRQQDGGKSWSNDFIPIRAIATPGVKATSTLAGGIRYGYREFVAFVRKNDKITIEWDNRAGAQDVVASVVFTGYLWMVYGPAAAPAKR